MKLWGIIRRNQKIIQDHIIEIEVPEGEAAFMTALKYLCIKFDLSLPVVLSKHTKELEKFNRTVFKAGDFIEPINFDSFEIEIFDKKNKDE